jgi:hypothetical protein
MKRIMLIIVYGFVLGIFAENLHHLFVTGVNPVIGIFFLLIFICCFMFEIVYLYKNSVKKYFLFIAIIINFLFIGGLVYLKFNEIEGKNRNYFSFTSLGINL